MAEKKNASDPQLGLIVAELRKLNHASKKDLIRDKEDRDRAERMAAVDEVQVEQQSGIMTAGQDFQRRFLAGQAKTLIDKGKLGQGDEEKQPETRGKQDILKKMFEDRWKALDSAKGEADREAKKTEKDDQDSKKKDKSGDFGKSSFLGKAAKGAAGMGLMGLGVGAFMSGLMVWSGVKAFRGEGFPAQAKNISEGWEHFGKMSTTSIATLGIMLAGGAFLGMAGGVGKSSKAAIGMTAMGAGIGGFMSGIAMAGSITKFDGATFAEQSKSLASALTELGTLSAASLATLGIIAVAGAGLGYKSLTGAAGAAAGASLAGAAIGGFMTGIVGVADVTGTVGTTFKDQAANTVTALKSLETLDEKTLVTLGVIAAGGALISQKGPFLGLLGVGLAAKASLGASAAGAAIGGFMVGMAAPAGITKVEGEAFKINAVNTVAGIKALETLDEKTLLTLGVIAAGGAVIAGKKGVGTAMLAMTGASIAGASIGGFMVGMATPAGLTKVDGSTFKDNALNTVEALKALETLNTGTLVTLGLIAGAGAAMMTGGKGKVAIATAGRAAAGASIMGAGIGGFMVGMTASAKLGSMANVDGTSFKNQAKNIAEGLGAFTGPQQAALAAFITVGAGLGVGTGMIGSVAAAAGMTAMGAGIGGFFAGLAGVTGIASFLGADGAALGVMLNHMGGGLSAFNDINGSNLTAVGLGIGALGLGIAGLGTALFGTGTADTIGDAVDGVKNVFNWEWLSGKKDKDTSTSGLDNLITSIIEPMKKLGELDGAVYDKAEAGITAVVGALNAYNGLKIQNTPKFSDLATDFAWGAQAIDAAMNGGTFTKGKNIVIGTGLKDITKFQFDNVASGIDVLQKAMFVSGGSSGQSNGSTSTTNANYITNNSITFSPERVIWQGKPGGGIGGGDSY